jgi:hypothetical protein
MDTVVMDLLPRDAELARRAAGGDGAAFMRLYDRYSEEVFNASLAATGSVEAAADSTQTAFLRILRWPPALGAPDGDVAELLCALALGGATKPPADSPHTTNGSAIARLVGVGWLRSETVAKAGARFDDDWSVHLWSPDPAAPAEPAADAPPKRPRRRMRLPRFGLPLPSPAATAAAVVLLLFAGAAGTLLMSGGATQMEAAPAAETSKPPSERAQARERQRARARRAESGPGLRSGEAQFLRNNALEPLLAP